MGHFPTFSTLNIPVRFIDPSPHDVKAIYIFTQVLPSTQVLSFDGISYTSLYIYKDLTCLPSHRHVGLVRICTHCFELFVLHYFTMPPKPAPAAKGSSSSKSASSKDVLHYFNARGRGELIRLLRAQGGVEYVDDRVEFEKWPELQPSKYLTKISYLMH